MKKTILALIILLIITQISASAKAKTTKDSTDIKVMINNRQVILKQAPLISKDLILLPLTEVATQLGATVSWDGRVVINKNNYEIILPLESKSAFIDRQVFFMEQIPLIEQGHVMVSLRFISEIFGVKPDWDKEHALINITTNGDSAKLPQANNNNTNHVDKYYQLYDIIIGPSVGPNYEDAKNYVLKEGLLKEVKDIQKTYIGFNEAGSYETMVTGLDANKQEKLIWLSQDPYIGEISLSEIVSKKSGLSQEEILAILQENSIDAVNIKKLYIAPFENQINWFIIAEQDENQYFVRIDYYSGEIIEETVIAS